jgi:hypothetical protein
MRLNRSPRSCATAAGRGNRSLAEGPVHLTRRGRVVVLVICLVALFGMFSLGRVSSQAAVAYRPQRVVVTAGETLWQLAQRVAPATDPRITVASLMAVNHLTTGQLVPGEVLLLPRTGG